MTGVKGLPVTVFGVLALCAFDAAAQPREIQGRPNDPATFRLASEESRGLIAEWQLKNRITGMSISVTVDGRVVWSEGFGWADLERLVPATPLTRFRVGSVSKMFAAVALVKLVEQRRIDLDAPIQQ